MGAAQLSAKRSGHRRATRCAARSLSRPATVDSCAALRYCEGHLHRIDGEAAKQRNEDAEAQRELSESVALFREAAELRVRLAGSVPRPRPRVHLRPRRCGSGRQRAGAGAAARLHADGTRDEPARRRLSCARHQLRAHRPKARGHAAGKRLSRPRRSRRINAHWNCYVQSNTLPKITENIRGTQASARRDASIGSTSCSPPEPERQETRARRRPWNRPHRRQRMNPIGAALEDRPIRGRDAGHGVGARPARTATASARRLDARHAVLAATSLIAVVRDCVVGQRTRRLTGVEQTPVLQARAGPVGPASTRQPERDHDRGGSRAAARAGDSRMRAIARRPRRSSINSSCRDASEAQPLPNVGALLDAKGDARHGSLSSRAAISPPSSHSRSFAHREDTSAAGRAMGRDLIVPASGSSSLFWWARGIRGDYQLLAADASADRAGLRCAPQPTGSAARHDALRPARAADGRAACCVLRSSPRSTSGDSRAPASAICRWPVRSCLSVVLIVLGAGPTGSNAKVNLGPLQPVEFIRLLLALFLAGYFARRWDLLRQVRGRTCATLTCPRWLNMPRADYVLPVVARRWRPRCSSSFCRRISGRRCSSPASSC